MPVPAEPSGFDTRMSELGIPARNDAHAPLPKGAREWAEQDSRRAMQRRKTGFNFCAARSRPRP